MHAVKKKELKNTDALSVKGRREVTRNVKGDGGGKVAIYMNERSVVISLDLLDLVELSRWPGGTVRA